MGKIPVIRRIDEIFRKSSSENIEGIEDLSVDGG
jgi:hypothetical protein